MESLRKRKRARIHDDDDTCVTRKRNMIDDLPESLLLLEIFLRLRNPRDVIVCKSVSKRWNSLISSSSLFDHNSRSLALILNTNPLCATNDLCLEGWKGFQLSNYVDTNFDSPLCVLASYRDVLLCSKSSSSSRRAQLYIVNPVTMRWTRLPKICDQISVCPIGLSGNGSKDRYYVVTLLNSEPSHFCLTVFDSKSGTWTCRRIEYLPWSQFGWEPTQFQGLNFEGSPHWLAQDGPIVAYSPNNHRLECIIIHRSKEMRHASYGNHAVVSETLTVSTGHLRIIQMVCYPLTSDDHHHLAIWTLVDYKKSIWKREHDPIYFSDMVSDLPWIQDYMRGYSLITANQHGMSLAMKSFAYPPPPETRRERIICPQPLHCHTDNPLLVYLYLPESIVLLDVATKKLRLVTRVDKTRYMGSRYWSEYDKVIPMTLHLDPSLVPDKKHVLCHWS